MSACADVICTREVYQLQGFVSMSAAVQARQDTLLSPFKEGAAPGRDKSNSLADSQIGGSQVAYAPAARIFLEIRSCCNLESTNALVLWTVQARIW